MLLRFIGAICFLSSIRCDEVKAAADNRVRLRCNENHTMIIDNQSQCTLKSTRCVLSEYRIDRYAKVTHPRESNYISCLIYDRAKIDLLPTGFFSEYPGVKYINLSFSRINKIADNTLGLPFLAEVNLRGNELISLSAGVFNGALNLRKIDLSNNKISIIQIESFSNLKSLEDLNLSRNQLNNNSFSRGEADWTQRMENLKALDLSYNQLYYDDTMPYQAFAGLVNLETLNLRSNHIKIDYGALSSNQKLKNLDFSYNNMTYFDLNYLLSVRSLESLYLHANKISYASQIDLTDVKAIFPNIKALGISHNTFSCEVLSEFIKKMDKARIELVIEEGNFVNDRRNLRGVTCI